WSFPVEQDTQAGVGFCQRHPHGQGRPTLARNRLATQARLLTVETLQFLGMFLDRLPDRVKRASQVGTERDLHRQGTVVALTLPQSIPRQRQFTEALHVGPRLLGIEAVRVRFAIGSSDAKDPFPATQVPHPLAIALVVAVARVTETARMRMDQPEDPQPL